MKTGIPKYEKAGIAALLPGMQYLLGQMQAQIDELSAMLTAAERADIPPSMVPLKPKRGRGRPPGSKNRTTRYGWSTDPEERKVEMARRMTLAKARPVAGEVVPAKPWKGAIPR
jgi:hypothetical protein